MGGEGVHYQSSRGVSSSGINKDYGGYGAAYKRRGLVVAPSG